MGTTRKEIKNISGSQFMLVSPINMLCFHLSVPRAHAAITSTETHCQ